MSHPHLPPNLEGLAVAWFRKSDWAQWCEIDREFQPDYERWLSRAQFAFETYQAAGYLLVKITIDPDEFLEWSRANGGKVDTHARALFATQRMMQQDSGH